MPDKGNFKIGCQGDEIRALFKECLFHQGTVQHMDMIADGDCAGISEPAQIFPAVNAGSQYNTVKYCQDRQCHCF